MKNDDRSDLIFDDLYEPDISGMDLTDEEMEKFVRNMNDWELKIEMVKFLQSVVLSTKEP